jgi:hypothetical protein
MTAEPDFRSKPFLYDIGDLQALAGLVQRDWVRWYRIGAFTVFGIVAVTILIDVSIIPEDLDWTPMAAGLIAAVYCCCSRARAFARGYGSSGCSVGRSTSRTAWNYSTTRSTCARRSSNRRSCGARSARRSVPTIMSSSS